MGNLPIGSVVKHQGHTYKISPAEAGMGNVQLILMNVYEDDIIIGNPMGPHPYVPCETIVEIVTIANPSHSCR